MRFRVLLTAGLLVATLVVAVLVLDDGGQGSTVTSLPTRTSATMIPVTPLPDATSGLQPTPTPVPPSELPPAVWTRIQASETERAREGSVFLLDLETGYLYSPTEHGLPNDWLVGAGVVWTATEQVMVHLVGFSGGPYEGEAAQYLGGVLGPMRKLPSSGKDIGNNVELSSDGLLAYFDGVRNVLFDTVSNRVIAELPGPPATVGHWSADGRYLLLSVSPNRRPPVAPTISVWDTISGQVVDEVVGDNPLWANTGHRFGYGAIDPADPEMEVSGLRVHDVDTGADQLIPEAKRGSLWSPDDRYLVIDADSMNADGRRYAFRVYDTLKGRYTLTVRGAWPEAWLDEGRLGFTGNVCGAYGFYTIATDGQDLREVRPSGLASLSPLGGEIAYTIYEPAGNVVTVQSITTGETRTYQTGQARLYSWSGASAYVWSPDAKYLVLSTPPGKGGPCEFDKPQALGVEVH